MNRTPQRHHVLHLSMALVALAFAAGPTAAQNAAADIPSNATAITYGKGWRCDAGFREVDTGCVRIVVPANAFANDLRFGSGWECKHGFVITGQTCTAVAVPPNAYLEPSGNGWRCDRRYHLSELNNISLLKTRD